MWWATIRNALLSFNDARTVVATSNAHEAPEDVCTKIRDMKRNIHLHARPIPEAALDRDTKRGVWANIGFDRKAHVEYMRININQEGQRRVFDTIGTSLTWEVCSQQSRISSVFGLQGAT
eukprot:TRINITY_DN9982_c0_g1_i2.p1 TRINITY_DN9982_c0_g1~~TRINITY_DN9982_c0_g1_i2.p1  ORF type:complete len:120 (-),score=4.47 TRINITY_DN9982_c0_g1_i2:670-1029(-)